MLTQSLFDVEPPDGAAFIDNLMLSSINRLLSTRYADLADDPVFRGTGAAPTLLAHDLLNLAIFAEAVILSEHLYVNCSFTDRWAEVAASIDRHLPGLITGAQWPPGFRWDVEHSLLDMAEWRLPTPDPPGIAELSQWVSRATQCSPADPFTHGYPATPNSRRIPASEIRRRLFMPDGETSRSFGGGVEIGVGTGFYCACSEILGVPYWPSALRAHILSSISTERVKRWRIEVGGLVLDILAKARDDALKERLAPLVDTGYVELRLPSVLAIVLPGCGSVDDFLYQLGQLRSSPDVRELREWTRRLSATITSGDLMKMNRQIAEVKKATQVVHRRAGLEETKLAELRLGWGPLSLNREIPLPRSLDRTIRTSRYAWVLQQVERATTGLASIEREIERIIIPTLPTWFASAVHDGSTHWRSSYQRIKGGESL